MFAQTQNAAMLIASYTSNARFNSRHATPLAIQLQGAAPVGMTEAQRTALGLVVRRADEVDEVRKARLRMSPPALRGPRNALASAWTALHGALLAVASVPAELGPEGPEAGQLAASLFPEGTMFAQADAAAVWSHSKVLSERIEEEGLRARISTLVSPKLLAAVQRAHAQLGAAMGLDGSASAMPSSRALADATARFSYAVAGYARALSVGLDESDVAAMERFAGALAPIDALRISGRAEEEGGDDVTTEVSPATPTGAPTPGAGDPVPPPFVSA
jgi:hypothetical protein